MWVGLSPAVSQAWRGLPWMRISSPHCGQSTLSRWLLSATLLRGCEMIQNAIRRSSSFNVIHLATMFKSISSCRKTLHLPAKHAPTHRP